MAVVKMCNAVIFPLHIGNLQLEWCKCIKYLGVYVVSYKHIKFDINPVMRSSLCGLQLYLSHSHGTSEIAILTLQETLWFIISVAICLSSIDFAAQANR